MNLERGDTIEYLGAALDDKGARLRGRRGIVEDFYRSGKGGFGGAYMMKVRFAGKVYAMSQDAPLRVVKHARHTHRSRTAAGHKKPRFRVGQTVKFRARTHHGEPVSYGRVVDARFGDSPREQPLYRVKLPNGTRVLVHQDSLIAAPRSRSSRDKKRSARARISRRR